MGGKVCSAHEQLTPGTTLKTCKTCSQSFCQYSDNKYCSYLNWFTQSINCKGCGRPVRCQDATEFKQKCVKCESYCCPKHMYDCEVCGETGLCEAHTGVCPACPEERVCLKHLKLCPNGVHGNFHYACQKHVGNCCVKREYELSDVPTFHYDHVFDNTVFLYNARTKCAWKVTFDYAVPYNEASIIVGKDFYVVGGHTLRENVSATYSVNIEYARSCAVRRKAMRRGDLKVARCFIGLVECKVGKSIYAIGGAFQTNPWHYESTNTCERYDIAKNTWNKINPLNEAKHSVCACEMDGYIYAIAGCVYPANTASSKLERLSILDEENKWETVTLASIDQAWVPGPLYEAVKVSPGKILVFGGYTGAQTDTKSYILTVSAEKKNQHTISSTKSTMPVTQGFWRGYTNIAINGLYVYGICIDYNVPMYNTVKQEWRVVKSLQWD